MKTKVNKTAPDPKTLAKAAIAKIDNMDWFTDGINWYTRADRDDHLAIVSVGMLRQLRAALVATTSIVATPID